MKTGGKQICRLCLAIAHHEIDDILANMLEVLLLEMNSNIIQNPTICETCTSIIKRSFYFKSVCTRSEKLVASFTVNKQEAKFELTDIIHDKRGVELAVEVSFRCRFCLNVIRDNNFVCIETLMEEVLYKKMLPVFMPEIDFSIIKSPIVCAPCKENLDSFFEFIIKMLHIEKKIYTYCQNMGTNRSCRIKPCDILNFVRELTTSEELEMYSCEPMKTEEILYIKTEEPLDEDEYSHAQNNSLVQSSISSESDMYTSKVVPSKTTDTLKHKCTLCAYATKYKRSMKQHMLTHKDNSEIDMYKCPDCPYSTKWKAHLKKHVSVHKDASEIEMYKCELCSYTAKHKSTLQRHALTHKDASKVETYKCTQCSYQTTCKRYLTRHMPIHMEASDVEMYKCELCTYTTKYKCDIQQHVLTHKNILTVEYKCTQCPYETKSKSHLKNHSKVHQDASEVEMYKCELCSYKTKYYRWLTQQHMLIHKDASEVATYKCTECPYETKCKRYLKSHMLVHKNVTDVKANTHMYKCSICPYETKWKSHLKRHSIIHKDRSELEMFKCSMCDYQTKYQIHLKTHMHTHK